jgi:hypothetical protein
MSRIERNAIETSKLDTHKTHKAIPEKKIKLSDNELKSIGTNLTGRKTRAFMLAIQKLPGFRKVTENYFKRIGKNFVGNYNKELIRTIVERQLNSSNNNKKINSIIKHSFIPKSSIIHESTIEQYDLIKHLQAPNSQESNSWLTSFFHNDPEQIKNIDVTKKNWHNDIIKLQPGLSYLIEIKKIREAHPGISNTDFELLLKSIMPTMQEAKVTDVTDLHVKDVRNFFATHNAPEELCKTLKNIQKTFGVFYRDTFLKLINEEPRINEYRSNSTTENFNEFIQKILEVVQEKEQEIVEKTTEKFSASQLEEEITHTFNRTVWDEFKSKTISEFGPSFAERIFRMRGSEGEGGRLERGVVFYKDLSINQRQEELLVWLRNVKLSYEKTEIPHFLERLETLFNIDNHMTSEKFHANLISLVKEVNLRHLESILPRALSSDVSSEFGKKICEYLKKETNTAEGSQSYVRHPQWKMIEDQRTQLATFVEICSRVGKDQQIKETLDIFFKKQFPEGFNDSNIDQLQQQVQHFLTDHAYISKSIEYLDRKIQDSEKIGLKNEISNYIASTFQLVDITNPTKVKDFIEGMNHKWGAALPSLEQIAELKTKLGNDDLFYGVIEATMKSRGENGQAIISEDPLDLNNLKFILTQLTKGYNIGEWENFRNQLENRHGLTMRDHVTGFLDSAEGLKIRSGEIHYKDHALFRQEQHRTPLFQKGQQTNPLEKTLEKFQVFKKSITDTHHDLEKEEFEEALTQFVDSYSKTHPGRWLITQDEPLLAFYHTVNRTILEKEFNRISNLTTPQYAELVRSHLTANEPDVISGKFHWKGYEFSTPTATLGNETLRSEFLNLEYGMQLEQLIPSILREKIYPNLNEDILRKYLLEVPPADQHTSFPTQESVIDVKSRFELLSKIDSWIETFKSNTNIKDSVRETASRLHDKITKTSNTELVKVEREFKREQFAQIFLLQIADPYYKKAFDAGDPSRLTILQHAYKISQKGIYSPEVVAKAFRSKLDELTLQFMGDHNEALKRIEKLDSIFAKSLQAHLLREFIVTEAKDCCLKEKQIPFSENIEAFIVLSFMEKFKNIDVPATPNTLKYISDLTKLGVKLVIEHPRLEHRAILEAMESEGPNRTKFDIADINQDKTKLTSAKKMVGWEPSKIDMIEFRVLRAEQTMAGRIVTWEETLFPLLLKFVPPFAKAIIKDRAQTKAVESMNRNFAEIDKSFKISDKIKEDEQRLKPWLFGSSFFKFLGLGEIAQSTYETIMPTVKEKLAHDLRQVKNLNDSSLSLNLPTLEATLKEAAVTPIVASLLTRLLEVVVNSNKKYRAIEEMKKAGLIPHVVVEDTVEAFSVRNEPNVIVLSSAEDAFINATAGINGVTSTFGFKIAMFFGTKISNFHFLRWLGSKIAGSFIKLHLDKAKPFDEAHRELLVDNINGIMENAIVLAPTLRANHPDLQGHLGYVRYLEGLVKQNTKTHPINIKKFLEVNLERFGILANEMGAYKDGINAMIESVPSLFPDAPIGGQ